MGAVNFLRCGSPALSILAAWRKAARSAPLSPALRAIAALDVDFEPDRREAPNIESDILRGSGPDREPVYHPALAAFFDARAFLIGGT